MAAAAKLTVTPQEYFGTGYHPGCALVNEELQERNLDEGKHLQIGFSTSGAPGLRTLSR